MFRVQTQPGRFDFFVTAAQSPGKNPVLPAVYLALDDFMKRLTAVSPKLTNVYRQALVVNVSQEVKTSSDAVTAILQQTGIKVPFADASDFVFQINRRTPATGTPAVELNRIMKWQSEAIQEITLTAPSPTVSLHHLATLSADVNVVVMPNRFFNTAEQDAIWGRMVPEVEKLCLTNNLTALQ
jgi:hypothetical protein